MRVVSRTRLSYWTAAALGILAGLLLWCIALGARIQRHEPGLWTVRFSQVITCGLDYNGPPLADGPTLWLTCSESDGWQLWPP
jgi:hypothetical protein